MKILVTGGAGYIGSVTADHLRREGHEVVVLDSLVHGHRAALPDGVDFVQADIADEHAVSEVLQQNIDAVLHFAAFIQAGESMEDPGKYFENNTVKSHSFIQQVVEAEVEYFVLSSTAAVYESNDERIKETDPIAPVNVYGQTKRMIEEMLYWYGETKGLKSVALRYFNAAGATLMDSPPPRGEEHANETHLIPNVLQVVLGQREEFHLFGDDYPTRDGTCVRDYIHVDDLARAHAAALTWMEESESTFEAFNLGNGNGYSNREVVETAREVTGHEIPLVIDPPRPGDGPSLVADSSKAQEALSWQPQHPKLMTIIESAWEWHKSHPDGYEM